MTISRYISSDLSIVERRLDDKHLGSRLVIDDKIYMALTPDVYAWLRRQMEKAHSAYKTRKMSEASWNTLRQRFHPIHDWAIETWGKEIVAQSLKKINLIRLLFRTG